MRNRHRARDHRVAKQEIPPAGTPMRQEADQDAPKRTVDRNKFVTVPFADIQPLLDRARKVPCPGGTVAGYDVATWGNWKTKGQVPLRAKYSLMGILAEHDELLDVLRNHRPAVPPLFDHDELMIIFSRFVLNATVVAVDDDMRRSIVSKLAQALTD